MMDVVESSHSASGPVTNTGAFSSGLEVFKKWFDVHIVIELLGSSAANYG